MLRGRKRRTEMKGRREEREIGEMEGGKGKEGGRMYMCVGDEGEGIHCVPGSFYSINLHGNRIQL